MPPLRYARAHEAHRILGAGAHGRRHGVAAARRRARASPSTTARRRAREPLVARAHARADAARRVRRRRSGRRDDGRRRLVASDVARRATARSRPSSRRKRSPSSARRCRTAGSLDAGAPRAERGLRYIDAPVTGLPAAAAAGELTLLVGADAADLEAARPLLDALATRVLHFGPVGAGTAYKLAVNLIGAVQIASAAEGLGARRARRARPRPRRRRHRDEPSREPAGRSQHAPHGRGRFDARRGVHAGAAAEGRRLRAALADTLGVATHRSATPRARRSRG